MLDMDLICWWEMESRRGKIGEGIKGYEDGGMIDDYYAMAGIDIGRWVTDTFKKELSDHS